MWLSSLSARVCFVAFVTQRRRVATLLKLQAIAVLLQSVLVLRFKLPAGCGPELGMCEDRTGQEGQDRAQMNVPGPCPHPVERLRGKGPGGSADVRARCRGAGRGLGATITDRKSVV